MILDTPGLRALGLWDAAGGIARVFPEIEALATQCRFRDCNHQAEPACAVRDAVESGELEESRYRSWMTMRAELDALDQRMTEREWRRPEQGRSSKPNPGRRPSNRSGRTRGKKKRKK